MVPKLVRFLTVSLVAFVEPGDAERVTDSDRLRALTIGPMDELSKNRCQFQVNPRSSYFWDSNCGSQGGRGCMADGQHVQCRYCNGHKLPACPGSPDTTTTTAPRRRRAPSWFATTTTTPTTTTTTAGLMLEEYLRLVDEFLSKQPRNGNGLLQTFAEQVDGGDCGTKCELPKFCPYMWSGGCRFDVYDNALAAIYFVKRGALQDAKKILDGFRMLLYPLHLDIKKQHLAYFGTPSGRPITLLPTAYTIHGASAGTYEHPNISTHGEPVDTSFNIWVAMAFAHYSAATNDGCYSRVAHDILYVLMKETHCPDVLGGFMGKLEPGLEFYRRTEHNIAAVALARMLGDEQAEKSASKFVKMMFDEGVYTQGTKQRKTCDKGRREDLGITTTATLWTMAIEADDSDFLGEHQVESMGFVSKTSENEVGMFETNTDRIGKDGKGVGDVYHGFRYNNKGSGINWEITASSVVGMVEFDRNFGNKLFDVNPFLDVSRDSLKRLLRLYGNVPASILGGNIYSYWDKGSSKNQQFPGGSDSGLGWSVFRYPKLASTVWAGFALMLQNTPGGEINFEANPFRKPEEPVPSPTTGYCPL